MARDRICSLFSKCTKIKTVIKHTSSQLRISFRIERKPN